jgi:hypothetical protein
VGESITTRLDAPYGQQPETRAAAVRVLTRLGAADVIEILGLDDIPTAGDTPAAVPAGRNTCASCHRPLNADGRACRRVTCATGRTRHANRAGDP